jgi:hypothetical protein
VARAIPLLRLKKTHDELYEKNSSSQAELATAKRIQKYIIPTDFSFIQYPGSAACIFQLKI